MAVLEQELALMDDFLSGFMDVDSRVLARPFVGKTKALAGVTFGPIDFYVPGVISLLLQHIALTLAALAIVRERVGGSIRCCCWGFWDTASSCLPSPGGECDI